MKVLHKGLETKHGARACPIRRLHKDIEKACPEYSYTDTFFISITVVSLFAIPPGIASDVDSEGPIKLRIHG